MKESPKWLWPAVISVVIVALVAIALLREPIQLDPTTPEGAVQEYLQAISDKDYEAAFELLHPESFEGCNPADIVRPGFDETFTASIPESEDPPASGRAFVDVTMRFGDGGPFGGSWESNEVFVLISEDGSWWITGDPWPYFVWSCVEEDS